MEDYKEVGMQGIVFGKHYNVVIPNGEFRDAHCSTFLAVITEEKFVIAKKQGWVGPMGQGALLGLLAGDIHKLHRKVKMSSDD